MASPSPARAAPGATPPLPPGATPPLPPGQADLRYDELSRRMHEEVQESVLRELVKQDMDARHAAKRASRASGGVQQVLPLVLQHDKLRDSALRFLGYANELGEAFRPFLPQLVVPSYAIAWTYVAVDTADKAWRAHKATSAAADAAPGGALPEGTAGPIRSAAAYAADTLLWQGFASVIIPGFVIQQYVSVTGQAAARLGAAPGTAKLAATVVGLATIPFLVAPVDDAVHHVLDKHIRPRLGITPHAEKLAMKAASAPVHWTAAAEAEAAAVVPPASPSPAAADGVAMDTSSAEQR